MLHLDALSGGLPGYVAVLTTRTATLDMAEFARARELVVRAIRRRWPKAQYAYALEYTTGYGTRSDGERRPHWNWLFKNVPEGVEAELAEVVIRVWCKHVDAEPPAQYVAELRSAAAYTKYITAHFSKESQRPPTDFKGQRFCCSQGYFGSERVHGREVPITRAVARRRAVESMRQQRALWRVRTRMGLRGEVAELEARRIYREARATPWVLTNVRGVRVGRAAHRGDLSPLPSARQRALELEGLRAPPPRRPPAVDVQLGIHPLTGPRPLAGPRRSRPDHFRPAAFDRTALMRRLKMLERWSESRDEERALELAERHPDLSTKGVAPWHSQT